MNPAASRHSSIVGIASTDCEALAASSQWRECLLRASSRTPLAARQTVHATYLFAYRGDDRGFFEDDRQTVMLDGNIENLREVAAAILGLDGLHAKGDTALIAELFARRGDTIFAGFEGSFALAIVTRETGTVFLARDRFGDKPLFYALLGTGWAWASEIKCLCPLLDRVALDPEGLRQAIRYRYVLGHTLVDGVQQVMPACFVRLTPGSSAVEKQYWTLQFRPMQAELGVDYWADRVDAGFDAYFSRLRTRYRDIAILLSGGVDSSLLAVKAARSGFRSCVALTAKWPGENPELESAIAVARHVGIEHRIVDIDESWIEESFPWIVWRLEEPPRHYNSFVLARLFGYSSGRFDTLLNGHAADALFGAQRYVYLGAHRRRRSQLRFVPALLRDFLAARSWGHGDSRVARLKSYLQRDEHEFIKTFFQIDYSDRGRKAFGGCYGSAGPSRPAIERFYDPLDGVTERFQRLDTYTFSQSTNAVFDRLGAPFGIHVSVPFHEPEIAGIAQTLPSQLKAEGGSAKPVLKALAARYFPREWIYRQKQGFPTHTSRWLEGPLSRWRRELSNDRTASRGILDVATMHAADPVRDYEAIWTAMTLELFCRQFVDGEGGPPPIPGKGESAH